MLRDWYYTILYWVEDNLQVVLSGIILVVFITVMIVINMDRDVKSSPLVEGVKENTVEEVKAVTEVSKEVDEVFSLLDERFVGTYEEFPAYEVDLYLKKPFIQDKEFKEIIEKYVEIFKWKEDYKLSGLKIKVYDRKEVYDKGLMPRAIVHFFKDIDLKQYVDDEEGGVGLQVDALLSDNFINTISMNKKPNYKDYVIRVDGFKPLKIKKDITPLTDQEFTFFLKMNMYQTLLGGSKYGGAKLYLQWDLGKDIYRDGIVAIEREFENFYKRHTELGGQTEYYDNVLLLKQQLAIEKPQFLLFVLTKKVVDDPLDAQRELIKEDPDLFARILEEYIDKQVQDLIDSKEEDDDIQQNKEKDNGLDSNNDEEEYIEFGEVRS